MADKLPLQAADDWLFTVEVRKSPQGPKAVVIDHRASLAGDDPGKSLLAMSELLEKAVPSLKAMANGMKGSAS